MPATTTMLHIRVDENVKEQAAQALAAMGLSIPDVVRAFLTQFAVDKQLPFSIRDAKTPNAASRAAMAEGRELIKLHRARFASADALADDSEKASHTCHK